MNISWTIVNAVAKGVDNKPSPTSFIAKFYEKIRNFISFLELHPAILRVVEIFEK